jgi:hypothetical protein
MVHGTQHYHSALNILYIICVNKEKITSFGYISFKKHGTTECQWLMPVILETQEAEIRKIKVQNQPKQIV